MPSALLVRFRPAGPWRLGPDNGATDRTDRILHSDAVYSALTIAMRDLGWLEDWLAVTAHANGEPALRLTSCCPWTGRLLMVEPPRSLWPVAQTGKLRWKSARFVPASLIPALIRGEALKEDQWAVDPVSECLLPVTRNGPMHPPFRPAKRRFAAVDRETGVSESAREVACLQFAPSSGMWFAAVFASDRTRDQWTGKFRSACRLLADQGIGGGKSVGWGRSDEPRFETVGDWYRMLTGAEGEIAGESAWWLLSLFTPGPADAVDWKRGNYGTCVRSGRVSGTSAVKPPARMVAEGSVLLSASPLTGAVRNVAAEDAAHPVYRSGLAVAVPIPWKESRRLPWMVEAEPAPALAAAEEEPAVAQAGADAPVVGSDEPASVAAVVEAPVVTGYESASVDAAADAPVVTGDESASVDAAADAPVVTGDESASVDAAAEAPVVTGDKSASVDAAADAPVVTGDESASVEAAAEAPVVTGNQSASVEAAAEAPVVEAPTESGGAQESAAAVLAPASGEVEGREAAPATAVPENLRGNEQVAPSTPASSGAEPVLDPGVPVSPEPSSQNNEEAEQSALPEGEPVTPVAEDTPQTPVEEPPAPAEPPAEEPPSEEPPAGEPPAEEPPVTDPDPNREGTLS